MDPRFVLLLATGGAAEAPVHAVNWYAGWALLLASFGVGAVVGLFFTRGAFLGGYGSFRRRLLRLGHVALAALGMLNLAYAISPWPSPASPFATAAGIAFLVGGIAMPLVCFLTAWRRPFRHAFVVPVSILVAAVVLTLLGGGGVQ